MLIECLKMVEDDRSYHGKEYPLWQILLFTIFTILVGGKTYTDVHTFILGNYDELNARFNLNWRVRPTVSCIRKIITRVCFESIENAFRKYANFLIGRNNNLDGRQHLCFDGKTLRGSFSTVKNENAKRILNVFSATAELIVAHAPLETNKDHEIPTLQELLKTLELAGVIVTADAMHCQKKL
jgi:hypothetical protein